MIGKIHVPPFPRWTGVTATLGRPHLAEGRTLQFPLSFRITKRARLWMLWLRLTRRGVPRAAP